MTYARADALIAPAVFARATAPVVPDQRSRSTATPSPRTPSLLRDRRSLERQADDMASRIIAGGRVEPTASVEPSPRLEVQSKCAGCGGGSTGDCACPDERVQRKARPGARENEAPILVDDGATAAPGQMTRSAFLAAVRARVIATCNDELAVVGRSADDCPYIHHWLAYYQRRSARQIERAGAVYSAMSVTSAAELVGVVVSRVRAAVRIWVTTGRITGIPTVVADDDERSAEAIQTKGHAGASPPAAGQSPAEVRAGLGPGRPLDGGLRRRMERGFGRSFASVRVHTDGHADRAAARLDARAFTVGRDIAFATGEYRPGTVPGDLLIAHELAHTVQQGATGRLGAPAREAHGLEDDADQAAVGAVLGSRSPSIREGGGLRLQRCGRTVKRCPRGYSWRVASAVGVGPVCDCVWRCLPGERPTASDYSSGPVMRCPPEQFCDQPRIEEVDLDYEQVGRTTTTHAVGAHMTPMTGAAACGCLPLDMEGEAISDVPLRPSDFEMTDVVGPLVERAAAQRAANPRTGVRQPEREPAQRPRPSAPMTPPPSHVGAPPEPHVPPGGAPRRTRGGPTSSETPAQAPYIIRPRTHVQQIDEYGCGAACGQMAAATHRRRVPQERITAHPEFDQGMVLNGKMFGRGYQTIPLGRAMESLAPIRGRSWRGMMVFPPDMRNPRAQSNTWYRDLVRGVLDRGGGVFIARTDGGNHWIVVDAVSDTHVQIRDPAREQSQVITLDDFRNRFMGDVVVPEARP